MIPDALFLDNFIARSIGYSPIFLDKHALAAHALIGFLGTGAAGDYCVSNLDGALI